MKRILSCTLGAALLCAAPLISAAEIDVMTQNQYLGADLSPVLQAATAVPFDEAAFNAAVVDALVKIAATRPGERARALAAAIQQRNPDVVGLQEAYRFACLPYPGVPDMPGMGCDDPSIKAAFTDHLQDTVNALGGKFTVAGKVTNLNVAAIPFAVNGHPAVLAVADRDAILVRKGLQAAPIGFAVLGFCAKPSDDGCNYTSAPPPFNTPLGAIAVERGFLAVSVTVKGRTYRVFNTHLEQRLLDPTLPQTRFLQVGQAYELLNAAVYTWDGVSPMIVVGDLNSAPEDVIPVPPYPAFLPPPFPPGLPALTPYQVFKIVGGFTDAWTLRARAEPGLTCCQAEGLTNRRSELYERIDLVLSFQPPSAVLDMRVIGNTIGDKTLPKGTDGLWPSDHAAVAAKLQYR